MTELYPMETNAHFQANVTSNHLVSHNYMRHRQTLLYYNNDNLPVSCPAQEDRDLKTAFTVGEGVEFPLDGRMDGQAMK